MARDRVIQRPWRNRLCRAAHGAPLGGRRRRRYGGAALKPTSISAEALFEAHREAMRWEWIAGHAHPERRFDDAAVRDAARPPTWSAT
jgi:hypothetical protein